MLNSKKLATTNRHKAYGVRFISECFCKGDHRQIVDLAFEMKR